MPPLITATTKVHSVDEKSRTKSARKTGEGRMYRWPEFDSRAGVSRLQPYAYPRRLAHASFSLRKATTPKNPVPLEPNRSLELVLRSRRRLRAVSRAVP